MDRNSQSTEEQEIRAILEKRVEAVRAKDLDAAVKNEAANVLSFDVVDPLQFAGLAQVRDRLNNWFSSFEGPIGLELRDLSITAGSSVAFAHSLNQVNATRRDGSKLSMWWRDTVCFQKVEGHWRIVHEHASVPFAPSTGMASLDLKP